MKFRFVGQYTGGRDSINAGGPACDGGVTFEGREPAEVENEGLIARLSNNPDFEAVGKRHPLDHDGNGEKGGSTGAVDHMRALRAEYTAKMGKKPFSGWDADTLREKMAA